jgi:hypothetical protein
MLINGKKTITENITVDVDPNVFLEKIYVMLKSSKNINNYIDSDGYWQVYEGMNYHKNEEVYKKGEKASDEDLDLYNAYNLIRKKLNTYLNSKDV